MSDNVNSVVPGTGPATDPPALRADAWIRLFWKGFGLAQTVATNGRERDPSIKDPEQFEAFLCELEDHVLDRLSLLEDICGRYESDAVREGARAGYLHVLRTGTRRVVPLEVNGALVDRNGSSLGSVSSPVRGSVGVGREVPDQNDSSAGSEKVLHLGSGTRNNEDPGNPENEEAGSGVVTEFGRSGPEETARILSALTVLSRACSELAYEVAHPDPRPGKRLAAEVAWVQAWRECKAAYLAIDVWGDDRG